jgi:hypothetical protein
MAEASYEKQLLATHAAGFINAAGASIVTFGCQLTRIAVGHYALLLDANAGLVEDESYTVVTPKSSSLILSAVQDLSNTEKRIRLVNINASSADSDIEVTVQKTVTRR